MPCRWCLSVTHLLSQQYPFYFMGFNFYLDHICVLMPFGCDYAKVVKRRSCLFSGYCLNLLGPMSIMFSKNKQINKVIQDAFISAIQYRVTCSTYILCMPWRTNGCGSNSNILGGPVNLQEWWEYSLPVQVGFFKWGKQWANSFIKLCFTFKIASSSFDCADLQISLKQLSVYYQWEAKHNMFAISASNVINTLMPL